MSKMDNLRAMREAKYAAAQARPKTAAGATTPAAAPKRAAKPAAAKPVTASSDAAGAATEELCGHKNMSGRTCTREKGHSAKSHRYS